MSRLFIVFNVVLYVSWLDRYLFGVGISPVRPFYWYAFTLGATLAVMIFTRDFRLPQRGARRMFMWAIAFATLTVIEFTLSSQGPTPVQSLITYMESALLLIAFLFLLRTEQAVIYACYAVLAVVILGALLNVIDFFSLSSLALSVAPGRAAGFYENPNISGNILVLGMVIATWVVPKPMRWWFCLLIGAAVLLTFSRSSMFQWALAVVALAWANRFSLPRVPSIGIALALVAAAGMAMLAGQMPEVLSSLGIGARLTADTTARITGSIFEQGDLSTLGRLRLIEQSFRLFLENPLLGHGLGSTYEWRIGGGTHNMYMMFAVEMGLVGVALFVALIAVLWRGESTLARIVGVLFAISSMFTHNNLEHPALMVILAIAASSFQLSGEAPDVRRRRLQAASRSAVYGWR